MFDYLDAQFVGLVLAVALGFLVGLERERAPDKFIGLRSFALIGALGGLSGLLADLWGGWIVAIGLASVTAIVVVHRIWQAPNEAEQTPGTTTMFAAAAVYLLGVACVAGYQTHAVVLGGVMIILLHGKRPLHDVVERIGNDEFNAIVRFVLITLVILPILPNDTYGPYQVVNPFHTWLLVVLIVALNLIGYVAFRLLSARRGAVIGGVLGGMISSTATTISFAGMTRDSHGIATSAALIILIASTIVYARVAVELAVVAPALLAIAAAPLALFAAVLLLIAAAVYPRVKRQPVTLPEQTNPARLQVALSFGALYVVILLALAAARELIGDDAIYAVAFVSGLTDVDAITLSVGRLFSHGDLDPGIAWRAIFIASLSNLLFKVAAACIIGGAPLRRILLPGGAIALLAGMALLAVWP